MANANISDLLNQYNEQSKNANSLTDGEINAKSCDCLDCCDCCTTGCLCTSLCSSGDCC